ncbi:MAG TPA: DinB family protein [Blastocatellia bacterium]|nr:DinB family protein [Blastocatellia bacterium]
MIYHTVADIMAANEQAQGRFIAAVSDLTEAQANFRPDENQWTIEEIVEHVSIVNEGFLRLTHKLLKEAELAPQPPKADLNLGHTSLDENGRQRGPFPAPDRVRPKGGVSVEDSLAKMRVALAGFAEIQSRLEAVDLSEQVFPHPALGPFNAYQWMVLLGEHENRHRGQIDRLKATDGFPA